MMNTMVKAHLLTLMAVSMMVNGRMAKEIEKAFLLSLMALNI